LEDTEGDAIELDEEPWEDDGEFGDPSVD